jgi:hypothetical protein
MCWLSGDPFPSDIKECLESWRKHLIDYEIWLWGKLPPNAIENEFNGMTVKEMHFDVNSTLWTKQAFEKKKYAFAADYIRLFALNKYGGIYLDADIMIYKNFDDLLDLPYFIGLDDIHSYEPAAIGAVDCVSWVAKVLNHYKNRSFILNDDQCDTQTLPSIFYRYLGSIKTKLLHKRTSYKDEPNQIHIFDSEFFNSRDVLGPKQYRQSYCSHCYAASWMKGEKASTKLRILSKMPKPLQYLTALIYKYTVRRNLIGKYGPKLYV